MCACVHVSIFGKLLNSAEIGGDEENESWSGGSNVYSQQSSVFLRLRFNVWSLRYEVKHASSLNVSEPHACVHAHKDVKFFVSIH